MGILTRSLSDALDRGGLGNPPSWLREALGAISQSNAGISVSPRTAMTFAAVYGAVNIISTDVAKLGIEMFKYLQPVGRQRMPDHPLDPILHDVFYEDDETGTLITAFHGKQYLQASALLWGNGYAQILFNGGGDVVGLFPLPPSHVSTYREFGTNKLRYRVTTTLGTATVQPFEMFHVKSVAGADTIDLGISPVTQQRESMGIGMAQQEYLARFYSNDSSPGGILTHPGRLRPPARKALKKSWEDAHSPLSRKHRVALLEEGVTWQSIGMPMQDAQFLENRKFQLEEVCRIYRLPPHKMFHMDKGDKSTIEQNNIEYVNDCLGGWLENWLATIKSKLLMPKERKQFFAVFNAQKLLFGDFATRMNGYAVLLDRGVMSPDDVREREDMNPEPDGAGTGYYHAMNMVDVTKPPPPPPAPPAVPKGPGNLPQDPGNQEPAGPEPAASKSVRSLAARWQFADSYRALFTGYAARAVNAAADLLSSRATDLSEEDYLQGLDDLIDQVQGNSYRELMPVMLNLAEAVRSEAEDEVNIKFDDDHLQPFVRDVATSWALNFAGQLEGNVRFLFGSIAPGMGWQDALTSLLDGWRAELPPQIGARLPVRTGNAVALQVFKAAGIRQKRWERAGECGWCDQLQGKVVGINDAFLEAGATLTDLVLGTLSSDAKTSHGPAHDGCRCSVSAVVAS